MLLTVSPRVYVEVLTGQQVRRDGKIACPFHHDRTPSLHAYESADEGWYCYGCRRGGRIYDFGAAFWGLGTRGQDFLALRRRLAAALLGKEAA